MSSKTETNDRGGELAAIQSDVEQGMPTALAEYNAEVLAQAPGTREAFLAMLADVPEADENATARIVAQILASESVDDLDAAWNAEGMREWEGTILQVNRIVKMPSDYEGGLGVYLVCYCSQLGVGEEFVLTTGSVSIVAQLVRAHALGGLPLQVVPRKAAKPSRNGYYPMHVELVRDVRARRRPVVIDQAAERA